MKAKLMDQKRFHLCMLAAIIVLILLSIGAMGFGQFRLPFTEVLSILFGKESVIPNAETVVWQVRLPRILLSLLAGAGMAVSGAAFQSLFSNALATPDTLGSANGAAFGAALGILLGLNGFGVQMMSLLGGISAILIVFLITKMISNTGNASLILVVLAGMVISSLFSALVSFVKYVADPNDVLPVITFWLMGSFSGASLKSLRISAPLILTGIVVLYGLRYRFNALSLSENEAKSLGINLKLMRAIIIVCASLVTASVVAVCGVIGWVGLLIPHISRMLFGNNHVRVIPSSIVFGAVFMLVTDTVARCATASEIPVSILTAVIGAPVFILLLKKTGGIQA